MHYYKFNLSDYVNSTAHLSNLEDLVYRRLLDYYYHTEAPIPNKTQWVSRRLRLVSEEDIVQQILVEFFQLEDDNCWHKHRCDEEIASFQSKAKQARVNGSKGGRPKKPKKTQPVNSGNPEKSGSKANQEPLTTNQEPKKTVKNKFSPPSLSEVESYISEKKYTVDAEAFIGFYESNGWKVGKNPMKSWKGALTTWAKRNNGGGNGAPKTQSDRNRAASEKLSEKLKGAIKAEASEAELDSSPVQTV